MKSMLRLETISGLLTFAGFVFVGLQVARKRTRPVHPAVWIALGLFVLIGWAIGINVRIIDVFGFRMCLNEMIEGFAIGLLAGLAIRKISSEKAHTTQPST